MKILRYILFPVVPIYYLVTWIRNILYDLGIKNSKAYDLPIICVGNLSVGGTGKTPMIEYLINLLKKDNKVATLSRGYKRHTKGFIVADESASALSIGDEPFQFYKKFNDIIVSVDADRQRGIDSLLNLESRPDLILLDDAFQHRKVKAGFYVLLTPYSDLYVNDMLLPTGNLREPKNGANRADVIVVTKCPDDIDNNEKQSIIAALKPKAHQKVFFSTIKYSEVLKSATDDKDFNFLKSKSFTLVTGIANPKPLVDFLKAKDLNFEHLNFDDHYEFTESDVKLLREKELIITTEKDFMRLNSHFKKDDNLFYLPIKTDIDNSTLFNKIITDFIK